MIYLELLWGFLKVGFFAFGGAYGAIPLIRDVILSYGWLSDDELTYMIAVSESTPGPIMVNLATYVGSSKAGLSGALLATLAVVLPSFFIILLVMAVLKNAVKNKYVQAVLQGLKPCMIGIVLATGIYMILHNCMVDAAPDLKSISVTAVLFLLFYGSRFALKKKIFPLDRSNGHDYIDVAALINKAGTGVLQKLQPVEKELLDRGSAVVEASRKNKKWTDMDAYYDWVDQFVTEQYQNLFD